ncbi:chemotaxis response regulator protein-glutamate methylesterase [Sphingomonas sp. KR1UV-12]|uniref:Protein-glutamate methylesterase/protein-glutamine glutaminase n=1 Tax=Sphingomonas aurea TaxID=3063994 RepID=A0ABT9EKA8_9SPHN|nr:chemotaxis response regulator protein-glutamate methylesterase [Sphingomonas sp. KR1UV-12]MDP1027262.1 chemotaxis response regulator protein-glutamate methylesterase [Sphingomonas sp. KR1UV-12]
MSVKPPAPVRVLIVDDSATMRGLLSAILRRDPAIEVVGEAADAMEARTKIKTLDPDVLTLDIEMPGMNGLDFLDKIMALRPMPVVIVSSMTERGAAATVRALAAGAFECFPKPASLLTIREDTTLAQMVKAAARCPNRGVRTQQRRQIATAAAGGAGLIAIGASTGGVETLLEVIGGFPPNCPPTVIVQHMPALFTASFADRLDRFCPPKVEEARSGTILKPGHVYLAPGGEQHMEIVGTSAPRIRLYAGDTVSGHRPSVDVLFRSVARLGRPAVGILLTGMGQDGAAGLLEMRRAGARTIGQDEATSVVFGMPAAAHAIGAVEQQLPMGRVAGAAMEMAA